MDVMSLQKQVGALCFELATRRYKHRKLVGLLRFTAVNIHFGLNHLILQLLVLNNLHSTTLQHWETMAELLSDSVRVSLILCVIV